MNSLRTILVAMLAAALLLDPITSSWAKAVHHSQPDAFADCGKHGHATGLPASDATPATAADHHVFNPPAVTADRVEHAPSANQPAPAGNGVANVCCDLTCTPADAVAEFAAVFPFVAKEATTPLSPSHVHGRMTGIDPPPPRAIAG